MAAGAGVVVGVVAEVEMAAGGMATGTEEPAMVGTAMVGTGSGAPGRSETLARRRKGLGKFFVPPPLSVHELLS